MYLYSVCDTNLLAIATHFEFLNLLQFPFMQRAIAGAVLMGILGGLLGSFVTLRQLSFFSDAVGHSALIGIVLGVLLQLNPTFMLLPFALVFGVVVLYFIDKTDLSSDVVLSIVLSGGLGIGIIMSSLVPGYRGNLMRVLFGDILAINATDLVLTMILLVGSSVFIFSTLKEQILLTLNLDVAQVQGVPVQLYRYGFIILLSLAVAVAITAVGALLVNAFLVIPPATAKLITHHFNRFLVLSMIIGSSTSILGILVSGVFNLASGPSIVVVQFFLFVAVFSLVKLKLLPG
jgi:zinc transport system permease protein